MISTTQKNKTPTKRCQRVRASLPSTIESWVIKLCGVTWRPRNYYSCLDDGIRAWRVTDWRLRNPLYRQAILLKMQKRNCDLFFNFSNRLIQYFLNTWFNRYRYSHRPTVGSQSSLRHRANSFRNFVSPSVLLSSRKVCLEDPRGPIFKSLSSSSEVQVLENFRGLSRLILVTNCTDN